MQTKENRRYRYFLFGLVFLVVFVGCGTCHGGLYNMSNTPTEVEMVMPLQVISASVEYMTTVSRQTTNDETRDKETSSEEITTLRQEEVSTTEVETTAPLETTTPPETTTPLETTTPPEATTPPKTTTLQETTTKTKEETTTKKKEEPTTTRSEEPTTMLDIDVDDYESVRHAAKKIVDSIIKPNMSEFDKVLAIHDWITFNIDYDFTYTNFYVAETLRDGVGVCQGYALTFELMAELAGLESIFVGGEATNSSGQTGGHAWNQVKVDGIWYCIDTVWDDPASLGKDRNDHSSNRYDYFLVSNETLEKNHIPLMEKKECLYDYDKRTVLKAAAESGVHKNVRFADSEESAVEAIDAAVKAGQKELVLWYYDTTVTKSNMGGVVKKIIEASGHSASIKKQYYPREGLTRYVLKL